LRATSDVQKLPQRSNLLRCCWLDGLMAAEDEGVRHNLEKHFVTFIAA